MTKPFTRTAQQKATDATNEFIRDFCERHEECAATRNEAHEIVAHLEGLAEEVRVLTGKHFNDGFDREIAAVNIIDQLASGDDQQSLAICLYAALVEKAKEAEAIQPTLTKGA